MRRSRPSRTRTRTLPAAILLALPLLWLSSAACHRDVPLREQIQTLRRPNLVLIVVDTLRADRIAPYGEERDVSPELARWGERGVVFERTLAQSSWTKVSMASLLTSLWPRSHAVHEPTDGLGPGAVTLAELLHDAGYRTYAVQSNGWMEPSFGFQQGFERYVFPRGGAPSWEPSMMWPHADNVYLEAARIVEHQSPGEPFFLYLHLMDVHEYAAPADLRRFGTDDEGAYRAAIRWVDEILERLRRKLDEEDLLDGTVLVLASDHGEAFGEHGIRGHARNLLGPVLRVPLVIRFPFLHEPIRVTAQVRNLDLAPTLLEIAGIPIPPGFEGESLIPLLDDPAAEDRPSYASLRARVFADATPQESVTAGGWTFARDREGGLEFLFDHSTDPEENVNLVELEGERAERLRGQLDRHLAEPAAADTARRNVRIDPALREKLRALGYLQ